MNSLNPGLIMIVAGLVAPLIPASFRGWTLMLVPVGGFFYTLGLNVGDSASMELLGYTLELTRVDKLSLVWGYIFHLAAFLGMLYALHVKDQMQQISALIYAGAAVGAVFAGDLITLFIYWELTAISSVFLIWASRNEIAYKAGLRYLLIQVGSGVILLAGVIIWYNQTGSLAFGHIGIETWAGKLIFVAFGIKCAFPLLHNWLQDSYPKATVTGTVILSAFTTKLAVYALARGFAGTEILIIIGATMTAFPIFFAVIENDLRKVLSYSLNNQLGFMVVGIGVGSELSLNGTASHAFAHILYKALLFMSMGAVLYRTGTCKASELGGLYKSMPLTTIFCTIGAMSISAFPLFSGFVTKSMIMTAAAGEGHWIAWAVLLMASAGVMEHSGIKIPYFAFFAHDNGRRVKEAPWNMLLAMAITAFLCIYIGIYPEPLYAILPFPVDYTPYSTAHVITQLQLLMFALLAFIVLIRKGWYPAETPSLNLDTDWIYRRFLPCVIGCIGGMIGKVDRLIRLESLTILGDLVAMVERQHGIKSTMSKTMQTGIMALIVLSVLLMFVLVMMI